MRYFLFLIVLLFIQCSADKESSFGDLGDQTSLASDRQIAPPRTAEPPAIPEPDLEKGSKIIKEGQLSFEVAHLKKAKSTVDDIVKKLDGYYEQEQYQSYGNHREYQLKIRLPNTQFDSIVGLLEKGAGKLMNKNISVNDVTAEFIDLNIRLKNNLAYLEQYKILLKKAKSIKEIIAIQEKIQRIETEIDSRKGRLKYLTDKVQFSTLNVSLSEFNKTESTTTFFTKRLGVAFKNGFELFQDFLIGVVNLWPFIILVFFFWLLRKNIFTLFRRNKNIK